MQNIGSWMQGKFSMILRGNYELIYISIPLIIIATLYANKFTVAGMGEDFAKNLGMDYEKVLGTLKNLMNQLDAAFKKDER